MNILISLSVCIFTPLPVPVLVLVCLLSLKVLNILMITFNIAYIVGINHTDCIYVLTMYHIFYNQKISIIQEMYSIFFIPNDIFTILLNPTWL